MFLIFHDQVTNKSRLSDRILLILLVYLFQHSTSYPQNIFLMIFHILSCNHWWILRQSFFLQGSTETLFIWNDMNEVTYLLVLAESSCFLKMQICHARQNNCWKQIVSVAFTFWQLLRSMPEKPVLILLLLFFLYYHYFISSHRFSTARKLQCTKMHCIMRIGSIEISTTCTVFTSTWPQSRDLLIARGVATGLLSFQEHFSRALKGTVSMVFKASIWQ